MSQTDPDILRAKFNIRPDMTLNIYYVEDAGENIIENGFNYEEPPQTDKQHIQLMKQKFNIPPNMTVNTIVMTSIMHLMSQITKLYTILYPPLE